ncbi:sensor histidine kinase [Mycolicibacterium mengxianglii]|uniref:sensor histidine kinase n=1 Tax=Mycolicibacterium mengxianglii TaxID=2736649 RepID=UPI0018EEF45A|nr:sensor histidine kinase [Mycolicibacterium mengxianglii]
MSVQAWLILVLSITGVVVLAGGIATAALLSRSDDVVNELIEEIGPSRISAYQLQAALRDQETAVRGYQLAADRQFLAPYYDGQRLEQEAADDIRARLKSRPDLLADLDTIETAAAGWRQTYAEPVITSVDPGTPSLVNNVTVEEGKLAFDGIRALFDVQNTHFAEARESAGNDLNRVQTWRNFVLIGVLVVFVVTAVLLAMLVRGAVTRPLEALAAACRRITGGQFNERIPRQGPRDIRSIATDVEDMRQRIVEELEVSTTARARLAQQAEALDEQAVELRRSNAELEQFAYVASHDLQEPLRKVASFCQLLEKRYGDKLDERGVEYIAFAVDGAKRMQRLINDLLAFSRVGRLNATYTEVDLTSTLDAGLANLQAAMEETDAEIIRPSTPMPHVIGDPTLLALLWQNLIGNAMKFRRPDTPPRIVIDCEAGTGDRTGTWFLSVSDNGIGIEEEFADKVFVIFQRLHGRDAYTGTGIGLAVCRKIVEHHGGFIWIDTSYTGGTRFCFTLPTDPNPTHLDSASVALEGSTP